MSKRLTSGTYLGCLGILLINVVLQNTEVDFGCMSVAVHIQEMSCTGVFYAQYVACPALFEINDTAEKCPTFFGIGTK